MQPFVSPWIFLVSYIIGADTGRNEEYLVLVNIVGSIINCKFSSTGSNQMDDSTRPYNRSVRVFRFTYIVTDFV